MLWKQISKLQMISTEPEIREWSLYERSPGDFNASTEIPLIQDSDSQSGMLSPRRHGKCLEIFFSKLEVRSATLLLVCRGQGVLKHPTVQSTAPP